MAEAIRLARRGLYTTDPNPRVGCVIVRDDQLLGAGWHVRAGGPHAEVHALQDAGGSTKGATAYVTLEPCSHQGRTPPCADALVSAGVARVVVANEDPNPLVAGQGIQRLRNAGIDVVSGVSAAAAEQLNPGFLKRMRTGLPYVRIKTAMSLDGRSALSNGVSQWITGPQARHDVQLLRARASAVLTGIETVIADDPSMNVRLSAEALGCTEPVRQSVRIVVDSRGRLSPKARLFTLDGPVWAATTANGASALSHQGLQKVFVCQGVDGRVDLHDLFRQLAENGINELHVEAGATLSGAVINAGLADELVIYMAGQLLGSHARAAFDLPEFTAMSQRVNLSIQDIRAVGKDWRIVAIPE